MSENEETLPRNPGRGRHRKPLHELDDKTFQSELPDPQDFSTKTSVKIIATIPNIDEQKADVDFRPKGYQHPPEKTPERLERLQKLRDPVPSLDIDPEFRPKGYVGPPNAKEPGTAQAKHTGDGGNTPHQYGLPLGATELQDLIEHRHMNFSMGNIFKACYRSGTCSHSDERRDLRKIIWFAKRELARLL